MSFSGRVCLFISALAFLIVFLARVYIGGWVSFLYIPLVTMFVALATAIFIDIKYYAEVLTLRSTKYSMSMGLSLLIFLVLLVSMNVISVQFNKSIDITKAQLNTLSPEQSAILNSLDEDLLVSSYYRGQKDRVKLMTLKQLLQPYKKSSRFFKNESVDIYKSAIKAKIELKDIPAESDLITLVRYKDKKIKVDTPINQESLAQAITLATQGHNKKIYFLSGHGERSLLDDSEEGLLGLRQVLTSKGFEVESFSLTERTTKLSPKEQHVIAVVGSKFAVTKEVQQQLIQYVQEGGKLVVALDPKQGTNMQAVLNHFAFDFADNYIVSEVGQQLGRSPTTAVGIVFSEKSPVTESFRSDRQAFTLFEQASEVRLQKSEYFKSYVYTPLISTTGQSFTVDELKLELTPGKRAAKTLAVLATKRSGPQGQVLVVGDSDFLTNKDLLQGVNQQLTLNSFSYLTGVNDLINKAPSVKQGSKIILTDRLRNTIVVAGSVLPLMLFLLSGLFFIRRKGA